MGSEELSTVNLCFIRTGADPEGGGGGGGFGDLFPLNFLEVKIIKNVKKILEVNGEKRLALKCSQEIRTGRVFLIIIWRGIWSVKFRFGGYVPDYTCGRDVFRIIHRKMYRWWGYLEGICSALYPWRGICFCIILYIYTWRGDFFGQLIFQFIY